MSEKTKTEKFKEATAKVLFNTMLKQGSGKPENQRTR